MLGMKSCQGSTHVRRRRSGCSRPVRDPRRYQEPDGTIFVFLDESYAPYVAYAGVVLEASDAQRLERKIEDDFERMRGWHHLKGLPSFEKFRARGFHASENPPEIQAAFVAFLSETLNFKSMIVYSDRSERPDLGDKKRLMIVLDHLVRDILRKYRRRPKVVLYFESAQAMDPFIQRVAIRAARAESNGKQRVEVRFGTKRDPDLLAVPDYVLRVFGKWRYSFEDLVPGIGTEVGFRCHSRSVLVNPLIGLAVTCT